MKLICTLLLSLTVLLITSCTFSVDSKYSLAGDHDNTETVALSKEDFVGFWKTTAASIKKVNKEKPASEIITSFRMNADATVDIYYENKKEEKIEEGTWEWDDKKIVSKGAMSANISSRVMLIGQSFGLGMLPKSSDGRITLEVSDYLFEKQ